MPMPWSMVSDVALVDVQLRLELCPRLILVGFALKATVGGGAGGETLTVAEAVIVAPLKLAVPVYVVVAAGVTFTEPAAPNDPTPLSILTEFAPGAENVSVED